MAWPWTQNVECLVFSVELRRGTADSGERQADGGKDEPNVEAHGAMNKERHVCARRRGPRCAE